LWNNDILSSTAPVAADVFLEDEFEICAGDSGLQDGDDAQVLFLSSLNGQIDVGEGNLSGTHSVTYTSSLFASTVGGRPIAGAELRYSQFLGRIGDPEQVPVMERAVRLVDVTIGQTLRIDTRLHGGFGGSSVPAGFDRPVTNELDIRGQTQLLLANEFLDICINSLGGAPLYQEGDEPIQDAFDAPATSDVPPPPFIVGRRAKQTPLGSIKGRAIYGTIGQPFSRVPGFSAPLGQIIVLTEQGEVMLLVDADTRISAPPDSEVGLEVLTHDPPTRVAVLADRSPLADDGTLSEQLVTAVKIAVIPQVASRQHRRVVVAEKNTGDRIKFVDEAAGLADLAAKTNTEFDTGENIVILVQKGSSGVQESRIKAVFKADMVEERFDRWLDNDASGAGDAVKRTIIDVLLENHLDDQANKLGKISDVAPQDIKAQIEVKKAEIEIKVQALKSELDDRPPLLDIISPAEGEAVAQGTNIILRAKATGENLELDFVVDGIVLGVEGGNISLDSEGSYIQPYRVPNEITSFVLEVKATDSSGQTAAASRTVRVTAGQPPEVSIVSPAEGTEVEEGSSVDVKVQVTDEGEIADVEIYWPIVGDLGTPSPVAGYWASTLTAPTVSTPPGEISGNVLPHVFVGGVTIGGTPAPDGTEVVVWVEGGSAVTVDLVATATNDSGQLGEDTIKIDVLPGRIRVASTTVSDGTYSLQVPQLVGASFKGRKVTFTVNGVDAPESKDWKAGEGDVLALGVAN
jgi:hypothetical protein